MMRKRRLWVGCGIFVLGVNAGIQVALLLFHFIQIIPPTSPDWSRRYVRRRSPIRPGCKNPSDADTLMQINYDLSQIAHIGEVFEKAGKLAPEFRARP
jgi:hypothetical protein